MSIESQMAKFLLHLNAKHDVRREVEAAERNLPAAFQQEAKSIAAIAKEAGFDVREWDTRPSAGAIHPFSCCGFMTWGTEEVDKALA